MNEPTALTRWLVALGRAAVFSWPTAAYSAGSLLAQRRAEQATTGDRRQAEAVTESRAVRVDGMSTRYRASAPSATS